MSCVQPISHAHVEEEVMHEADQGADALAWLDVQPNKAGYVKALIRADMEARGQGPENPEQA